MVKHDFKKEKQSFFNKLCGQKASNPDRPEFKLHDFNIHTSIANLRNLGHDENLIYKELEWICYAVIVLPVQQIDVLYWGKCPLHSLLDVFLELKFTDERDGDLIELLMIRSEINYEEYQEGVVLKLLQEYDRVKYYQWLILNNKEQLCIDDMNETKFFENSFESLEGNFRDLLQVTFAAGALKMLKILWEFISKHHGSQYPILAISVSCKVLVKDGCREKYYQCFDYLIEREDVDINAVDKCGETAFYIACKMKNDHMVNAILKKKPYLAALNKNKDYAVTDLDKETLTNVLDSCVSTRPDHIIKDELSYDLLKSYQLSVVDLDNLVHMDLTNFFPSKKSHSAEKSFKSTELIQAIANSDHLKETLTHPVIGTLLEMKWMQLRWWILLRKQTLFLPILVGFFLTNVFVSREYMFLVPIAINFSLFVEFVVIAASFRAKYFSYVSSIINICMLQIMVMFFTDICKGTKPVNYLELVQYTVEEQIDCLSVTTPMWILMGVFCNYFIAFFNQTVSHYTIMLVYVSYSMIKFLISNIFLAIGFTVGYIQLFKPAWVKSETSIPDDANKESAYKKLGVFKVFAMLAGYIDGVEVKFYADSWAYVLHAFLIFITAIVAVNLINGLAVGDVSYIQTQAQFWHRRVQCMMLYEFEGILSSLDILFGKISSRLKFSKNKITEHRYIALRTTTGEILTCDRVDEHKAIAKMYESSVTDIIQIANKQKEVDDNDEN